MFEIQFQPESADATKNELDAPRIGNDAGDKATDGWADLNAPAEGEALRNEWQETNGADDTDGGHDPFSDLAAPEEGPQLREDYLDQTRTEEASKVNPDFQEAHGAPNEMPPDGANEVDERPVVFVGTTGERPDVKFQ